MPHHRRRDSVQVQQLLQRAHLNATQAHVKLDIKDQRITLLETDKVAKDAKLLELETDKTSKDTAMADLTARLVTLENGNGGGGGGDSMTSEAVSWTNLTEINLSGEKLINTDFSLTEYVQDTSFTFPTPPHTFANPKPLAIAINGSGGLNPGEIYTIDRSREDNSALYLKNLSGTGQGWHGIETRGTRWEVVKKAPTNWTLRNGTLDADQLALGRVDGVNGAVAIQQMFSSPLAIGTKIIVKVERYDTNTGNVGFRLVKSDGNMHGNLVQIPPSTGFVEYTVADHVMAGIRLDTLHGTRSISSISVFQGAISGGSVQVYAGGGLEKISGVNGWNAGASSVQKIDGNSDGYVQFQWGQENKSLKVGLTYLDADYDDITPFQITIVGSGNVFGNIGDFSGGSGFAKVGDWFRVRHYSTDNEIKFQRKQTVYQANPTTSYEIGTKIIMLQDFSSAVKDEILTVYTIGSSGVPSFEQADGTRFGAQAAVSEYGRGNWWQVAEEVGQDYITFFTHPTLTNGSDLYFDTSFFHVEARLNDVTIVR